MLFITFPVKDRLGTLGKKRTFLRRSADVDHRRAVVLGLLSVARFGAGGCG